MEPNVKSEIALGIFSRRGWREGYFGMSENEADEVRRRPSAELSAQAVLAERPAILERRRQAHRLVPDRCAARHDRRPGRHPVSADGVESRHLRWAGKARCRRRRLPGHDLPAAGGGERVILGRAGLSAHDRAAALAPLAERPRDRPLARQRALLSTQPGQGRPRARPNTASPRTCAWRPNPRSSSSSASCRRRCRRRPSSSCCGRSAAR